MKLIRSKTHYWLFWNRKGPNYYRSIVLQFSPLRITYNRPRK